MITRRNMLFALGAGAVAPVLPARAQRGSPARIGWISYGRGMGGTRALEAFRSGLGELGYVDGRGMSLVERWGEVSPVFHEMGHLDRIAGELVGLRPDVIVTVAAAVYSVLRAGATMPIVFAFSGDPIVGKLVDSFAHPGRNLTGLSFLSLDLVGKRMQLLKEAMPRLRRVAIVANPQHVGVQAELRASQDAARTLGIALDYFQMRNPVEMEEALAAISKSRSEAIVVFPDAFMMSFSGRFAAFARNSRIPAISGWAHFAEEGNLMSYGPEFLDSFRRLATYVDKILKGARPADLPVELPTKFELVVNLKTASALGVKIPQSILVRADRVIE